MPIPTVVSHADLVAALKPLCDLLGTNVRNFYAVPGMVIEGDEIRFTVPTGHEEFPNDRATSLAPERKPDPSELPPHPQGLPRSTVWVSGGEDGDLAPAAELGYEIVVRIDRGER